MFNSYVGKTVKEKEFFYEISERIQKNLSQFIESDYYFFRLEHAGNGLTKITEYRYFRGYEDYATFIYGHEYEPKFLIFVKKPDCYVHMAMNGFYFFLSHEVYETEYEYLYEHQNKPTYPPNKMPPRDMIEDGFRELKAQFACSGDGSKSSM
jgi:hypothetical protein